MNYNFNVEFVGDQPITDVFCDGFSIGAMLQFMWYDGGYTAEFCGGFPSIMADVMNPVDATGVNLRSLILEEIMGKNPDMEFPKISFSYRKDF